MEIDAPLIFTRDDWGARRPKFVKNIKIGKHVMVTWTDTEECEGYDECLLRLREIQNKNMDEDGLPDIKYNFLIADGDLIFEGRGWDSATKISSMENCDKLKHMNKRTILVAYIGPKGSKASPEMRLNAHKLAHYGVSHGHLVRNVNLKEPEDAEDELTERQMTKMRENMDLSSL